MQRIRYAAGRGARLSAPQPLFAATFTPIQLGCIACCFITSEYTPVAGQGPQPRAEGRTAPDGGRTPLGEGL